MTYTHGHAESVLRAHRWRNVGNSASYLLADLIPGRSLLDVGCGPGSLTADLAERLAPGRVVGIDSAEEALAEASELAARSGSSNLEFRHADVYELPYDDSSFDLVHAHQLLQHLEHPERALAEMARVCRAGGVVAARDGDYAGFTWYPADPLLDRWLEIYEAVARANGGEPDAGRRLKSWAERAGLENLTCSASVWCFSRDEDRRWWAGLWAERITATRLAERALELSLAERAELDSIAAAWQRWSTARDGWFTVLHGEIRCEV